MYLNVHYKRFIESCLHFILIYNFTGAKLKWKMEMQSVQSTTSNEIPRCEWDMNLLNRKRYSSLFRIKEKIKYMHYKQKRMLFRVNWKICETGYVIQFGCVHEKLNKTLVFDIFFGILSQNKKRMHCCLTRNECVTYKKYVFGHPSIL